MRQKIMLTIQPAGMESHTQLIPMYETMTFAKITLTARLIMLLAKSVFNIPSPRSIPL